MIKVIKTIQEYEGAVTSLETLLDSEPKTGTAEANKVELLLLLIKDFETRNFPIEATDPVDAIIFRMEQLTLSQRDLSPYIGSRSKVSEILSRKRSLTLSMIRALHKGLGIPIKSLIQESKPLDLDNTTIDWNRFPIKEMIKRGWIKEKLNTISNRTEEIMKNFLKPLGGIQAVTALYKRTNNVRTARPVDKYALAMWNARIIMRALENPPVKKYQRGTVDQLFMKEIVKFSVDANGPRLAYDYIRDHGIAFIVEPQLPGTHLDGAAVMTDEGPIIALSLRHDRIDNFWFCLMHELAHIALHFDENAKTFFDDLDVEIKDNPLEVEADRLAGEILVPNKEWENSPARNLRSPEAAEFLAKKLRIHPAIVAGKMRYFYKNYKILNKLVGYDQVRNCFPEIQNWS